MASTDQPQRQNGGAAGATRGLPDHVAQLRICVLGAGMAGLTSALALAEAGFKNIEVYEFASDLGFVGAGIQMAPNMARILDRLGVWAPIAKEAVVLNETSIREGATNEELGHVDLRYIKEAYGYEHMVGHRATLAGGIYDGCKRHSDAIKFNFGTQVEDVIVDGDKPSFKAVSRKDATSPPKEITCDILLGADGIKSVTRSAMLHFLKADAEIVDTGQAAYRIMLTREQMSSDPELLELIESDKVIRWIGEKRHIIAYPVSSKQIYNLSTTQPDKNFAAAPTATYTTKGSKPAMLDVYSDYCTMIQRMLNLVPDGEVCEWKLRVHAPLPSWVVGTTALVGDACHPTLPHLAQGAAQAIEDAAVLAVVLSRISDTNADSINKALKVYEKVRKERAESLVALAAESGRNMHLGSGAAKEERDKQFAALRSGDGTSVPDRWADAEVQRMIYGFDCVKVAEEVFEKEFGSI
ncbi:hypothetical protein H2198_005274 [Neophaeococcomyces mojaviensis]|uniref:Uncharacterized protein n=1 Tax=Neophaeococcomyces mojaviensis TaxID=3383035 RepID=A0ACC3A679_9EURO|nr:hypothetical protein H2198_005274 [Knufia sp. JES_112]